MYIFFFYYFREDCDFISGDCKFCTVTEWKVPFNNVMPMDLLL